MLICATCAVEYDEPTPDVCPICADERQWVPSDGQHWTTLDEMTAAGQQLTFTDNEPGLTGIATDPKVGIGQTAQLLSTPEGSLLWDPTGYVDDEAVRRVLDQGPVLAIAASHPHMFGVQVEWSHRLGDVPVLVAEADREWLGRNDSVVEFWSGSRQITEGVTVHQVGGHFVGSGVVHWTAGADGRGVLLTGDSVFPNPDHRSVGFLRSYPNKIPLSGAVVQRIADQLEPLAYDRIYGNFNNTIDTDAKAALRMSADRHAAWVRGDFDHLT
ncbi:MBL fold metallo-hydrolase [Nakamurella lactea]|uniref:MBL fold metallo-hydrolase n=1 Tax=Nakamurella lactea TaxID=459515 RepID=UPI00040DFF6A|nr:MBL fold metallo-hydrolase [Nakamurella lactea]